MTTDRKIYKLLIIANLTMGVDLRLAIGGTILCTAVYAIGGYSIGKDVGNKIPEVEKVQQGYIAPNKLEVECKDLDGNGELETIMKVGDKSYLLKDVNGTPVLSEYKVQVVTKE